MTQTIQAAPLSVAIIGSGMAGLCMAIQLLKSGIADFKIFEKADALGGTWRDNTYPGSGCDVPSHLYSFSFEPKADWSRKFAKQSEILHYMNHCANKYGLNPHIEFNTEITQAQFDPTQGLWQMKSQKGDCYQAHTIVCGLGQLNRPAYPKLPGMDQFKGKMFHSARWDHDYDLTGKTVAVVGTGASAIQFVPEVAKQAKTLHVFQRSPNWLIAKPDRRYFEFEKKLLKWLPFLSKFYRYSIYCSLEVRFSAFYKDSPVARWYEKWAQYQMDKQLTDQQLKPLLKPDYPIGCKRILISNNYLPTLCQEHVKLHTAPVTEITAQGVVAQVDGESKAFDVDAIILGTGFDSTSFLAPMDVKGLNGLSLNQAWADGAEAYFGMTVAGFPNFFVLYGPNTNLGHNSIIFMIESQVRYIIQCLKQLKKKNARYLDLDQNKMTSFNHTIQTAIKNSVWDSGCSSWYKTASGKITNNWPYFTLQYWWRTRKVDFDVYHFDQQEQSSDAKAAKLSASKPESV